MYAATGLGLVLTAAGVGGYVLGIVSAYPGRAFALTLTMAGITLLAVGGLEEGEEAVGP